jgi:hypothetical protein
VKAEGYIVDKSPINIFMFIIGNISTVVKTELIFVIPKVYRVTGIIAVCAAKPM